MGIFIASIILTLIASTYAVLLKRKLAETFFLAVITVIGALYCFGLINVGGCLLYGIYGLVILTLGCTVFLIYIFIRKRKILLEAEILQGCLLYVSFLAFFLFVNFGKVFHAWDEFSHWGTIVKYFYSVDAMGTFDNLKFKLMAPAYFPGTSLFQYFFTRFSAQFIEYYTYIAMNVIYFSLFMPFIKDIFKKEKRGKLLLLLVIFLLLPVQNSGFHGGLYNSLYVDAILGALFGFTVLYYFIYKYEESLYGILMVSASIFMLILTKDMGLLFALGAIGIVVVDIILYKRIQIKQIFTQKPNIRSKLKLLSLLALPLISIFFVKLTWANLLLRSRINSFWKIPSLQDIYMLFTKQVASYQIEIVKNFIDAMWRKNVINGITLISFCIIFIVIILLCSWKKIDFRRILTSALLLVAGVFIYQFVLMIMYVFSFGEDEAVRLASYARYTSSYLLGMMFFMLLFFISDQNEFEKINYRLIFAKIKEEFTSDKITKYKNIVALGRIVICSLMGIVLFLYVAVNSKRISSSLMARQFRPNYFETRPATIAVNKWNSYFKDTNPYLIVQGEVNKMNCELLIGQIDYELCPNFNFQIANLGQDWAIAPKPYDAGVFVVSPEEWEKYVLSNEFKLLYVYISDKELETTYGRFFPYGVQNDMVYYVQNDNDKLSLIPVVETTEK